MKVKSFVTYFQEFYGKELASKEEILIAIGIRVASHKDNGNGIRLCDIPFEGDSFDREYIRGIISDMRA